MINISITSKVIEVATVKLYLTKISSFVMNSFSTIQANCLSY